MPGRLLIYGATGFTGRLIAHRAKSDGFDVVLAGRHPDGLRTLSKTLKLPWRAVSLDVPGDLDAALQDVDVVLHVAGPFSVTARPMLLACLRNCTHYLDVTGEIGVFQDLHNFHTEACGRGVMIMPGVGFVVLASDCLAAYLSAKLPNIQHLRIAFSLPEFFSRGTLRTMVSMVREQVTIRRSGHLTSIPVGRLERMFDFGEGPRLSTAVNWADVYTAYFTTGIPNIEVYAGAGPLERGLYQLCSWLAEPMQLAPWQWLLELQANTWHEGPSKEQRANASRVICAEAEDGWRRQVCARLYTQDGYDFTVESALAVSKRVLDGHFETGFQTPAGVYGSELLLSFQGIRLEDVQETFSARI